MAQAGPLLARVGGRVVALLLSWISTHQWLLNPGFGPVVFALIALGIAVGTIAVMAGWRNRRVRYTALITAGIGIIALLPAAVRCSTRTSASG